MGHHIDSEGRFQSDLYPELAPDKIVLSFKDARALLALGVLAQAYQVFEPELSQDIFHRLGTITEEKAAAKLRVALEKAKTQTPSASLPHCTWDK